MTLDHYLQPSWIATGPATVLLSVLILLVILSYVWNTRVSSSSATEISWLRRVGPIVTVLVGPLLVVIGMANLLFVFGRPESVVLRSYAAPNSDAKPTPECFEADFKALRASEAAPAECKPVSFVPGTRIVDAGPLVEEALDVFALNNPLPPAQLGSPNEPVIDRMRSVVINVLSSMEPRTQSTAPTAPDSTKIRQLQAKVPQRWIALGIETAIVDGLTLLRNVRNIAVERNIANSDQQDPWQLLSDRSSRGIGANQPIVHLTSGRPVSSDVYVSLFGQPWLQQNKAGAAIYAMLLKGPREADALLRLRSGDGTAIPLGCGGTAREHIPIKDCVSDFNRWSAGTTRLVVLNTRDPLPVGKHTLELTIKETGDVRTKDLDDRSDAETIRVAAAGDDRGLLGTLNCLPRMRSATPFAPLANLPDGTPAITQSSPDAAAVLLGRETNQLWIYPADIDRALLAELKQNARPQPGTASGPDEPLAGLWLFPYLVRSDGLGPGEGQMLATPLTAARPNAPARWDTDPADGLSGPTSLWMSRYDARPALFAYAMDNYVRYTQRISPSSALPIGWRIDLAAGRKSGRAVVWVFQLDLVAQGLLLDAGCQPAGDRGAPEPAYDSARFVPFWSTILEAVRASADKGMDAPILTGSSDSQPVPVLLDDATKRRIHMRVARFGMLLVIAGMLMHAALMVWFRFSVANRPTDPRHPRGL